VKASRRRSGAIKVSSPPPKKAEEKLIHSHNLMQYIISHAQSAIAVHDRDMKYIYVSEQYLREYKVKERDVIGKHHYDVFPDLPQKWRDVHQRALAGAVEGNEEDPYVREDGSVDWTRWECRPWYESDGSIGGLIVYTEVITERKRREEELRRAKADMDSFFSVVPDLLCVASTDGYFKALNHAWEKTLGFTIPELLSKPFETWIHPDDVAPTSVEIKQLMQGDRTSGFTNRYRCKDGSYRWLEWNFTPAQGTLIYAAARDITERRRTEEALGASQKLLETIIDAAPS
jgi:PAS domain S-box-containing protein